MIQDPSLLEITGAPAIAGLTFRRYRGASDIAALVELMTAVEIADGTFEIMTAETLANLFANRNDFDPERHLLLAEIDGRLVAYSEQLRSIRDGGRVYDTYGWVHPIAAGAVWAARCSIMARRPSASGRPPRPPRARPGRPSSARGAPRPRLAIPLCSRTPAMPRSAGSSK